MAFRGAYATLLTLLTLAGSPACAAEALPKLGTDLSQTSVSGLSSGAYMAGQLQLAHADNIVGAGIVAGGPFACAEASTSELFPFWPAAAVTQNVTRALYSCMQTTMGTPDAETLVGRARELAAEGKIAPLSALRDHKIYLYSGNHDVTVTQLVVAEAKRFYDLAGVALGNVTLVQGSGGHAFITDDAGVACRLSEAPFVSDCNYDQARAILGWIYGPLEPGSPEPKGDFFVFDQQAFSKHEDGLAEEGVVYIPPACRNGPGCRVHVALHGCQQSRKEVGDTFIHETGYAEIADRNRIVILFPQIAASGANPKGCWDWWGYTGLDYLGKDAPQIAALWAMVEGIAEREQAPHD
jgi:poly(3-hydroxybutyrate) depolymerase